MEAIPMISSEEAEEREYYLWRARQPVNSKFFMPLSPDRLHTLLKEEVQFMQWEDELAIEDYETYYKEVYG
jgi:hypothetical protein